MCRNHRYQMLPETQKKTSLIVNRPTLKHVTFLQKYTVKQLFCRRNILTKDEFVNQLSSNAGISVSRILRDTINCSFISDVQV